ncbi:transmembrane protein 211 [Oncorhynchus tshawytscha]|uniref:Transmembrane protein 211 n=4 Tax=Salmoninae TaxID=504568 RepID=A0A1S3LR04_SALSA|nr:transmembrane protein 211 [Salmo salar]XP_024287503.1 transmembrane protein 211 [Oncorhynchus tshawytscha]XP_029547012.1 transmembrane protein 211-like [Salmo trutta]XP_031682503.1 transmembrane protein 211 [Oncorhynchus kisutch]XP_036793324.1 transmembrane protein 211 [Oncorhynchus mykiss]XP_045549527.1 transmembrane protein 211 [Salmo salar]XP_055729219.1 LHFPL tetraspan subfamily member 7 protein-like [Salvelinus fontinalis]|eukprot:XP_013993377.1 PREDICTED: transmembrane protein 211-like [Salmo salar]
MHSLLDRKKKEAGVGIELSPSYSLPQAARMFSCVGCFWVLLSSALVAICSFSFISPAWIVKDHLKNKDSVSFGLLWHCSESLDHMYRCYTFGGLGKFAEIPSSSWQTSAVLCSGGCSLLAVSSLLAIITIFLPSGGCERRICTLAGYMQMAAVFIMGSGLLVYPFGLNSTLVRSFCGDSDIYYAGDCQIGWGYMLAIVSVMLTLFLPFFAKYAPKEHLSPTPLPTLL